MRASISPNVKDHVVLTTFALTEQQPRRIRLRDHAIRLEGISDGRTWSGVYGINGAEEALRCSTTTAAVRGLQVFRIRSWCGLRDLELQGNSMTRASVERTGFLHIDRVRQDFRQELLESVVNHLSKVLDASALAPLRRLTLREVILRHPAPARRAGTV